MEEQEEKTITFKETVEVSLKALTSIKEVSENTKKAVELIETADEAEDLITALVCSTRVGFLFALHKNLDELIGIKARSTTINATHSIL